MQNISLCFSSVSYYLRTFSPLTFRMFFSPLPLSDWLTLCGYKTITDCSHSCLGSLSVINELCSPAVLVGNRKCASLTGVALLRTPTGPAPSVCKFKGAVTFYPMVDIHLPLRLLLLLPLSGLLPSPLVSSVYLSVCVSLANRLPPSLSCGTSRRPSI